MKPHSKFLNRETFNSLVLSRDQHKCVVCGKEENVTVHHLMERKLWEGGSGNLVDNGVTLCDEHHLRAETTELSCEELRQRAGIKNVVLPEHLSTEDGERYDKWGNLLLPNGTRYPGELFWEEPVQKVLRASGMINEFSKKVKYPRTLHLPWSPGVSSDDKVIQSLQGFEGRNVVVTVKMDGENSTLGRDYTHARSLDSKHHESRAWLKALHGRIAQDIPEDFRICGENMYAKHSLGYEGLPSYLLVFNVWERGRCLSWQETKDYCTLLDLHTVPVLYEGRWDEELIRALGEKLDPVRDEGYVVRVADSFHQTRWRSFAAKWVRKGHVQTDSHWMSQKIVPNKLAPGANAY